MVDEIHKLYSPFAKSVIVSVSVKAIVLFSPSPVIDALNSLSFKDSMNIDPLTELIQEVPVEVILN